MSLERFVRGLYMYWINKVWSFFSRINDIEISWKLYVSTGRLNSDAESILIKQNIWRKQLKHCSNVTYFWTPLLMYGKCLDYPQPSPDEFVIFFSKFINNDILPFCARSVKLVVFYFVIILSRSGVTLSARGWAIGVLARGRLLRMSVEEKRRKRYEIL